MRSAQQQQQLVSQCRLDDTRTYRDVAPVLERCQQANESGVILRDINATSLDERRLVTALHVTHRDSWRHK